MVITIDNHDFIQAFKDAGREDQFSLDALTVLFHHLEEWESQMSEPMELDVIAICCDYEEYDSIEDFQRDYGEEMYSSIEDIKERTLLLAKPISGFVIQKF
tara:strand:+ start:228 stop:530 length:303 start_codon:yes stop_codon:yes gene_type:complete